MAYERKKVILGDTDLDEIIFNLCDNAVKYNRSGGDVKVSVKNSADTVTVTVSDTGIGIPTAQQDRVFERFYRVDKARSKSNVLSTSSIHRER